MNEYILSIDEGTTGITVILFDQTANPVAKVYREIKQYYPTPGWVEHSPDEIANSSIELMAEVVKKAEIEYGMIKSIGITNQRETTILWDSDTGKPVYNAVVWQCRRSSEICRNFRQKKLDNLIKEKTGLVIDPYFSATKIMWLLDNIEGLRDKALRGKIKFGTVDSWLLWNLTNKKSHLTDYTNASRTMLFNIFTKKWDDSLCDLFRVPKSMLPDVRESSTNFGYTDPSITGGVSIPISGIAGDQQSALFGQLGFNDGDVKCTYGTGSFVLMFVGNRNVLSEKGLLTTIACDINGKPAYAIEGSNFISGAAIQWLRDELQLIKSAEDTEYYSKNIPNTNGVYVVPAFAGLGAPYWDFDARGAIVGLTRGANRNHIIRATTEAIAYQVKDLVRVMEEESGVRLKSLKVDGGASNNNFLMQFESDILNIEVDRPVLIETTALGSALLAGMSVGLWKPEELIHLRKSDKIFKPKMKKKDRDTLYQGWLEAVKMVRKNKL